MESLIRCGAFDFVGATRASLMNSLPAALERGQRTRRDRAAGQGSLFGDAGGATEPPLEALEEWPASERLAGEKEMLGFYISGHPLNEHADAIDRLGSLRIEDLSASLGGRPVRVVGLVSALETRKTRAGSLMARAVLEDLSGTIDVVIFPAVFDQHAELLRTSEPMVVEGTLVTESERAEMHLERLVPLARAWDEAVRSLCVRVGSRLVSRERLGELRRILDLAPGEVQVSIAVELPNGAEAVLDLTRHRVSVSEELIQRVDGLFGARVVQCAL